MEKPMATTSPIAAPAKRTWSAQAELKQTLEPAPEVILLLFHLTALPFHVQITTKTDPLVKNI